MVAILCQYLAFPLAVVPRWSGGFTPKQWISLTLHPPLVNLAKEETKPLER